MKILIIITIILFPVLSAQSRPLYEVGFLTGAGFISDYPGSNQGRVRNIVFPTFIYRGSFLRSDDKGTRARFYKTDKMDIDLSFGASFPANSKDNDAREGMSDLDWLGEIGPRLNIEVYKNDDITIEIELPTRFVFSTDFKFTKRRGYRFYPQIDIRKKINSKFKTNLSFKMNWASEELTDYFYEVGPNDILSSRSRYNAKGGYMGRDISANINYRSERLFVILGVRYSNFENSANENSPLFKSKEDTSFFLGLNYFFYQSEKKEIP